VFWQSLGKALGWKEGRVEHLAWQDPEWQVLWHRFIEYLADGKTTDYFFEKVL